jgi:hypothetical protein
MVDVVQSTKKMRYSVNTSGGGFEIAFGGCRRVPSCAAEFSSASFGTYEVHSANSVLGSAVGLPRLIDAGEPGVRDRRWRRPRQFHWACDRAPRCRRTNGVIERRGRTLRSPDGPSKSQNHIACHRDPPQCGMVSLTASTGACATICWTRICLMSATVEPRLWLGIQLQFSESTFAGIGASAFWSFLNPGRRPCLCR